MAAKFDFHPPEQPAKEVQQKVQAETAPAPVRSWRAILFQGYLIGAISAFALLALLARSTPYFAFDLRITRAIQTIQATWFEGLMQALSWPGFSPQSIAIVVFVVVLLFTVGLRWEAVMAFATAAGIELANGFFKFTIHRARPASDLVHVFQQLHDYSFPSGHVMFYTAFFGFLWFLSYTLLKPSRWRTALLVLFGGLVCLVGVSRIYLGEHWFSDVIGAYLLGSIGLAVSILIYRWGKPRFFVTQPTAAPAPSEVAGAAPVKTGSNGLGARPRATNPGAANPGAANPGAANSSAEMVQEEERKS